MKHNRIISMLLVLLQLVFIHAVDAQTYLVDDPETTIWSNDPWISQFSGPYEFSMQTTLMLGDRGELLSFSSSHPLSTLQIKRDGDSLAMSGLVYGGHTGEKGLWELSATYTQLDTIQGNVLIANQASIITLTPTYDANSFSAGDSFSLLPKAEPTYGYIFLNLDTGRGAAWFEYPTQFSYISTDIYFVFAEQAEPEPEVVEVEVVREVEVIREVIREVPIIMPNTELLTQLEQQSQQIQKLTRIAYHPSGLSYCVHWKHAGIGQAQLWFHLRYWYEQWRIVWPYDNPIDWECEG